MPRSSWNRASGIHFLSSWRWSSGKLFLSFYLWPQKTTETSGLELWTKHPGDGQASTAYEPGGRPTFDNLIYALWLIIISRLVLRWIIGRPKNSSKRRTNVVSCKIKASDSSAPGRINCGLGGSGGRVGSSCWHGVGSRRDHGMTKLSQGRGRSDRVTFCLVYLRSLLSV